MRIPGLSGATGGDIFSGSSEYPTLLGSFAPVRVFVCERLLPSVLGLGCVCGAASGVMVAFEELLLKVLASGPRCVSFNFLVNFHDMMFLLQTTSFSNGLWKCEVGKLGWE
jgi:hypothetical protein